MPGPLPPLVQRTGTYTLAELEWYIVLDADLEQYMRCELDYATYHDRYLAVSLEVEGQLKARENKRNDAARRARVVGTIPVGTRGG